MTATTVPLTAPAPSTSGQTAPARLDALTGLRFLAAAAIVLFHSEDHFGVPGGIFRNLPGAQTVGLFFVLSGFILTYAYPKLETRRSLHRFYAARVARLWPAHLAALGLLAILLPNVYRDLGHHWKPFVAQLFMVHAWVPSFDYQFSFNGPSWSISTEMGFYVLFPLLLWRVEKNWPWKLAAVATFTAGVILYCTFSQHLPPGGIGAIIYAHVFGRLFEFTLGMCAAILWKQYAAGSGIFSRQGVAHRAAFTMLEFSAVTLAVLAMDLAAPAAARLPWSHVNVLQQWLCQGGMAAVPFALLIVLLACGRGWVSKVLGSPLGIALGEMSFSLYLVHQMIFLNFDKINRGLERFPHYLVFIAGWATAFLAAHLLFLIVEHPGRWLLLRMFAPARAKSHAKDGPAYPWRWVAIDATALLLILGIGFKLVYRTANIHRVKAADMALVENRSGAEYRDLSFGPDLTLKAADLEHDSKGGCVLRLAWLAPQIHSLTSTVGLHFLDRSGKIVSQMDYPEDLAHTRIAAGTRWIDTIPIPASTMALGDGGISTVGVCVFGKRGFSAISAGPRDWDGHRLLIAAAAKKR